MYKMLLLTKMSSIPTSCATCFLVNVSKINFYVRNTDIPYSLWWMQSIPFYVCHNLLFIYWWDFTGGTSGKEPICQCSRCKELDSIPGWGRCPKGGHDNPNQYSFLENPIERGAWGATVHRVAKSWTWLKQLSAYTWTFLSFLVCCY